MASIIEIKGNKCHILNESDFLFLEGLDLELSFKIQGAEYSKAYRSGRWNGRKRLMTNNLYFSLGLLPRVLDFYKSENKEVEVIDLNKYQELNPKDIFPRLKEINKTPRYYQIDAAAEAIKQKRGIIRACTGSGKTLTAALIIAQIGRKAIFYVIGKDLLWQTHKLFENIFQIPIGMIGDGICNIQDITVASIWSVCRAFGGGKAAITVNDDEGIGKEKALKEEWNEAIKLMVHSSSCNILDECHIAASDTMQLIGNEMCGEYSIGLSASPIRDDGQNLLTESIFGRIIVNTSASELIEKKYLVKPVIKFISVPKPKVFFSNYREIYKSYIVNNPERNELIIRAGISLVEQDFITMILYKEIAHGKLLYNEFVSKNMYCHILSGNDSTDVRKKVIEEILTGKCKLVLASSIFDIGIDLPNLSGLVLAGGGKSSIRAIQRIGRVIRSSPGKEMAAIIDFKDSVKYLREHSQIRRRIYESEPGFEIEF